MKNNFNRFDEVEHTPLRVFNRVVLMTNLYGDFGKETAAEYIQLFSEGEKAQMKGMQVFIQEKGLQEARRLATKNMPLSAETEFVGAE